MGEHGTLQHGILSVNPDIFIPHELTGVLGRVVTPLMLLIAFVFRHSTDHTPMSLYDLHDAQLDDMDGEGFAYSEKTVYGKAYKGVFFAENAEDIETLAEGDSDATFTGILYDRSREREKSFTVDVTNVISTPTGERADFVATEKP